MANNYKTSVCCRFTIYLYIVPLKIKYIWIALFNFTIYFYFVPLKNWIHFAGISMFIRFYITINIKYCLTHFYNCLISHQLKLGVLQPITFFNIFIHCCVLCSLHLSIPFFLQWRMLLRRHTLWVMVPSQSWAMLVNLSFIGIGELGWSFAIRIFSLVSEPIKVHCNDTITCYDIQVASLSKHWYWWMLSLASSLVRFFQIIDSSPCLVARYT